MEQKTDFQIIGEESKAVWERFWEVAAPYRPELWRYCRKITGSPWDAEDLLQDTLLKAFASLSALSFRAQKLNTRSYLFRVATNHWIDQCRRNKVTLDDYDDEKISGGPVGHFFEIDDAMETLVRNLPPKQVVVLILMDSFKFTAQETADLIATTEGAVHAVLHRARKRIKALKEQGRTIEEQVNSDEKQLIRTFVEAFNRRDFQGVANLLDDHAAYNFQTQYSHEYGKDTITKFSLATTFKMENMPVAKEVELWGKTVVLFITETEDGEELNEVNRFVMEDGKIVKWSGYYFCREFMQAAADELNIPLELLDTSYLV